MINRELQARLKLMPDDFPITLVTEEGEGFNISNVLCFSIEKQIWITMDMSHIDEEEDDDDSFLEDEGMNSDGPMYEREGDTCATTLNKCSNPYCKDGNTSAGPCLICRTKYDKVEEVQDACFVPENVKVSSA